MSLTYVLEVEDEAAGLLVNVGNAAFEFVATDQSYGALDGRLFASPEHALRAAYRIYRQQAAQPADLAEALVA